MIEFKITADSAAEFVADLLATASRLSNGAPAAAPAVAEAPKEQPKPRRARTPNAETVEALNEAERGEVEKHATTAELVADLNKAEEPKVEEPKVEEPKVEEPKAAPAPKADGKPLDFDKDVAPLVLGYVKSHGKPWVFEVLEQFGVTRASALPAERLGELVAALNDKAEA